MATVSTRVKRSYVDGCAGAHALNVVGERWALLVVRELLLGARRFTDLRAGLPGVSAAVLTQRLTELEEAAVVQRRRLPPPAAASVYELTAWGTELETAIAELGRWGARSPTLPRGAPLSVASLILSFRTMFDETAAEKWKTSVELRVGEEVFHARVAHGALQIVAGHAPAPDAVIASDPDTLASIAYDGRSLKSAMADGRVEVAGDRAVARRFLKLFTLPERAPSAAALALPRS